MSVGTVKKLLSFKEKQIQEKARDYKKLLVLCTVYTCYALIGSPIVKLIANPAVEGYYVIGYMVLTLYILYCTFDMLKNFTQSKFLLNFTFVMMFGGVVFGVLANSFFAVSHEGYLYEILLTLSLGSSVYGTGIMLYYMMKDIFSEKHEIVYSLFGAAVIYGVISISFACLFGIFQIYIPDGLGVADAVGVYNYINCVKLSFYVISGMDSPFPNAHELFVNTAAIESFFANLYIVLVVGKLLSK